MPLLLFHEPLPQPNSANTYGPLTDDRSGAVADRQPRRQADATTSCSCASSFPFGRDVQADRPVGRAGARPARGRECPDDPTAADCADPQPARATTQDVFDRYAVAEYRTRFADDKAGITARAYVHAVRARLRAAAGARAVAAAPGRPVVHGRPDQLPHRAARSTATSSSASKLRVLYGAEAFHEWKPDSTRRRARAPAPAEFARRTT